MKTLIFLIGLMAILTTPALAGFKVSPVLLGTIDKTQSTADPAIPQQNFPDKQGFGYGLLMELTRGRFGLEVGGLYQQRKFDINDGPGSSDNVYSFKMLVIPVTAKFWLNRFIFVGVGGFYAKYLGDVQKDTTLAGFTQSQRRSYDQEVLVKRDYGFHGSFGFVVPISHRVGIHLEGRYARGMKQQNTDPSYQAMRFDTITALAGLTFTLK